MLRSPPWAPLLGAGILLALAAALPAAPPPIPLLRIQGLEALGREHSSSRPLRISRNGHLFLLKADAPQKFRDDLARVSGNFEAELVAAGIFAQLGVPAPSVRVVRVEGKPGLFLRVSWAADARTLAQLGGDPAGAMQGPLLRRIMLVDLLLGNPDRHPGNLLLEKAGSTWRPLPIDQDMALLTRSQTEVWGLALEPLPGPDASRSEHEEYAARYLSHAGRNPLTARQLAHPAGRSGLLREAQQLVGALPDPVLVRLLRDVPRAAVTGPQEPEERLGEILELLRERRDGLVAFLERAFGVGPAS